MAEASVPLAWLEKEGGEKAPLSALFSLGRSNSRDLTLPDSRVSRKHAVINRHAGGEYWITDWNSANGTYVNKKRISKPTRLKKGDEIRLGPFHLKFGCSVDPTEHSTQSTTGPTHVELTHERRWLLITDIVNSTELASKLEPQVYRRQVDAWYKKSLRLVAEHHGVLNKFLGDGFLACWPDLESMDKRVAHTIRELRSMIDELPFRFRTVLHFGEILVGGIGTTGEESLSGSEMNFIFRMERLAGSKQTLILISQAAAKPLEPHFELSATAPVEVPGFPGQHHFFQPKGT